MHDAIVKLLGGIPYLSKLQELIECHFQRKDPLRTLPIISISTNL